MKAAQPSERTLTPAEVNAMPIAQRRALVERTMHATRLAEVEAVGEAEEAKQRSAAAERTLKGLANDASAPVRRAAEQEARQAAAYAAGCIQHLHRCRLDTIEGEQRLRDFKARHPA